MKAKVLKWASAKIILLLLVALSVSCVCESPAVSKSRYGNLEVAVTTAEGEEPIFPAIFVDGKRLGNVSYKKPILYLRRGLRQIRVESPGYQPWEGEVYILGDPNQQYLHIQLKKSEGKP